jgi:Ca-activated chloride channel family protein
MHLFGYQYLHPQFFWLLLILPIYWVWYWYFNHRQKATLTLSSIDTLIKLNNNWVNVLQHAMPVLKSLSMAALIIALARPQSTTESEEINVEGIDIVLSMDISSSMLAEDFKPNRIEAAKKLAAEFIDSRKNDRIGLVVFGGESFTQCPITTDHEVLKNLFKDIHSGMIDGGTALGMGLATAVDRLKDSKAKSKVIILMTDGVNNTGLIDPETGYELAKTYGIRVYTIGVGTQGYAPSPVPTNFGIQYMNVPVEIDEVLLKKIANETGGIYFRATGNAKLKEVYEKIDKLEKTKIEVNSFKNYAEKYLKWAYLALFFLLMALLLQFTFLRSFP